MAHPIICIDGQGLSEQPLDHRRFVRVVYQSAQSVFTFGLGLPQKDGQGVQIMITQDHFNGVATNPVDGGGGSRASVDEVPSNPQLVSFRSITNLIKKRRKGSEATLNVADRPARHLVQLPRNGERERGDASHKTMAIVRLHLILPAHTANGRF